MDRVNVDTDQIIPKQFLKRIERTGFGQFLFFDWRYLEDGTTPNLEFELNAPALAGAQVLVVGKNLGSDPLARWLTEQGWPTEKRASAKGFRVLEVAAPAD